MNIDDASLTCNVYPCPWQGTRQCGIDSHYSALGLMINLVLAEVKLLADVPGAKLLMAEQDAEGNLKNGRYRSGNKQTRIRLAAIHIVEALRLIEAVQNVNR